MKWSAEQLKGLRGSVRKWSKIVNGTGTDEGPDNCPLCKLYFDKNCKGCPVRIATGEILCDGSPYELLGDPAVDAKEDMAVAVAVAELMFLKALLKVGSK